MPNKKTPTELESKQKLGLKKHLVPVAGEINAASDLGQYIKTVRLQSGLRIIDLAMLAGIATQTMVDIEAGKSGVSIGKILQVTDTLGITLFSTASSGRNMLRNVINNHSE